PSATRPLTLRGKQARRTPRAFTSRSLCTRESSPVRSPPRPLRNRLVPLDGARARTDRVDARLRCQLRHDVWTVIGGGGRPIAVLAPAMAVTIQRPRRTECDVYHPPAELLIVPV